MASGSQGLKAFVSEAEIEEKKKKRQEEWERVRTADQPEECPEEEYDPRSLFEKLQEQKDRKQEEYEEQFKFKNMVKGLDEDESEFLEEVSNRQVELEKQKQKEEKEHVQALRNRVVKVDEGDHQKSDPKKRTPPSTTSSGSKRSQASLLAGAVKRKRKSSDETNGDQVSDHMSLSANQVTSEETNTKITSTWTSQSNRILKNSPKMECVGILPGIGFYEHSSDDSSNSDSSDDDLKEVIGTVHRSARRKKTAV